MNRLLKRQLKKNELTQDQVPSDLESWHNFLKAIETSYIEADEGRYLLERSLDLSSKEMQKEIERSRAMSLQLAQAGKLTSLGTLASGVAHELNNPLAAIMGQIELITLRSQLNDDDQESLDKIIDLCSRMAKIIKHMLKLSRSSREEDRDNEEFNIIDAINDGYELLKRQFTIENINLNIEYDIKEQEYFQLKGNSNALAGVFQNLLVNSKDSFLDCSSNDLREINIKVQLNDEESSIMIIYKDNAAGIPTEIINKIFDPFYTTKDVGAGTGLGLSISRQVVEDLGGKIKVDSSLNQGTVFTLEFPIINKSSKKKITSYFQDASSTNILKIPHDLIKILVIDNDQKIESFVEKSFKSKFDADFVNSITKAKENIKKHDYKFIITNLSNSELSDGLISQVAKEKNPTISFIFISEAIENEQPRYLKSYEPYTIITKEVDAPQLLSDLIKKLSE